LPQIGADKRRSKTNLPRINAKDANPFI